MDLFLKPRRNSFRDNLLGALVCLVFAGVIYSIPPVHHACAATRVGAQFYLWTCGFPALTLFALLLAAPALVMTSWLLGNFNQEAPLGCLVVPFAFGAGLAVMVSLVFFPAVILPAFLAGLTAGLVFTFARDYGAAIFSRR
ncbi:MAG: hypothetical protein AAFY99_04715 [Pseudomonadota bacterium]